MTRRRDVAGMRRVATAVLVIAGSLGISVYKGIEPGKSTRRDVSAALGIPVEDVSRTIARYALPESQGKLLVEFRADSDLVDRIERVFNRPVSRAAVRKSLNLPDQPEEREVRGGKLTEYFGGLKVLSLVYAGADTTSGVTTLNYHSFESYDRQLNRARNLTVQFDPAACRDIYYWSQTERDVARKAKNTPRHQAILEINLLAGRGDCERARDLATRYKDKYR